MMTSAADDKKRQPESCEFLWRCGKTEVKARHAMTWFPYCSSTLAPAQIDEEEAIMGKVVSSCRRALLGWFLMFVPLPDSAEADGSAMRPLTTSLTVIHPCRVGVSETLPEKRTSKNLSALINMLCHETAAWRVEIKERVRKTVDDFTPHRSGGDLQLTINF